MATKQQIGAVIGIQGEKEYENQLRLLTQYTKEWKANTDALTSSFDKNFKSMSDVNKQRRAMQSEVESLTKKLEYQKEQWEKLATTMNTMPTDKEQKEFSQLRESISKTETELNNVKRAMNDLPADNFTGKIRLIQDNIRNSNSDLKFWGDTLTNIGRTMTLGFTVPIVAGMSASVKQAVDWESAMNGVRKTTDMSEGDLNRLGETLKDQALQTTYSSTELANLAQIAGQLGVRGVEDISKFVGVVSDLGLATDLSAEDAATSMARILNITEGGNLDNLEALGSVIVHLGNNMATTEPEIVAMANRMASAGHTAGLTTTDIFALSSALTSVGITAEAGGSTVGQVLTKMEKAFAEWTTTGEGDLLRIAELSGMSAQQFADAWTNEPVKAFEAFVTGLGNIDEENENLTLILDELGMAGIRESNMLKALAAAQEEGTDTSQLFSRSLELAKEAYDGVNGTAEEFNALENEASVRRGEAATQFSNLKESLVQLGQSMGETLLPFITKIVEGLTKLFDWLSGLSEPAKAMILTVLGLVAGLGPLLSMIGQGLLLFNSLSIAAGTLNMTVGALALSIGKWVLIGGAVVLAIGAIVAAIVWLKEHSEQILAFWEGVKEGFALIWEVVKFAFQEGVDYIGQKFEDFKKWVEDLRNKVDNGFRNMVQGVKNKFEEMKSAVANIRDRIDETFRNLINNALSWGKDLIGNIISGIKSKISSLVSSVKDVASTIWSYLHFSEPEKGKLADFHTWMPDFMHGLAQGIDDNAYLVENAINRVAGLMGNTTNYGGVVINLNVPQGANGRQLVDEIEQELANRALRRRAVYE